MRQSTPGPTLFVPKHRAVSVVERATHGITGRFAEARGRSPADSGVALRLHFLHGGVRSTTPHSSDAEPPFRACDELGTGSRFDRRGGRGGPGHQNGAVAAGSRHVSRVAVRSDQQLWHRGGRVSATTGTRRALLGRSVL